ncbi:MAG: nitrate reductase molybdenum cofactor assembly chaperone [Mycobacteriales bacterium]
MRSRRLTSPHLPVVLRAVSSLLRYPDEELLADLPLLTAVAAELPADCRHPLTEVCRALAAVPLPQAQAHYVDTFDLRRKCCLYLTYWSHGDTRKRGMALLRFSHTYRAAGVELTGDELPDHLAVVCEFAALTDREQGLRLLTEHRAGLELLREALAGLGSPYARVLDALRAALPPASPRDLQRAAELARTGPPEEEVGLAPYGPPETLGARR